MASSLTSRKPAPDDLYKQRVPSYPSPDVNGAATHQADGKPWPRAPPPWVDDRTTDRCMYPGCTVMFDSIYERRHHCRFCGLVFCQGCSFRNAMLPPEWGIKEPQRVCHMCHALLNPYQAQWVRSNANAERENFLDDDETSRYMNSPLRFTLGGEIRKASYTLQNLIDPSNVNYWERDCEYTTELLEAVEGLLFMTVGKIAFIGGLRVATGLLVARLADGSWSAPCAVGSFGITFGACVGAEVTDMVTGIDKESMDKFTNDSVSNVMLGGEASLALGPFGRTASGEVHVAAVGPASNTEAYMSYSQSRGAFGGITIEAAYVKVRDDVNEKFYGYAVQPKQILNGTVPRPKAAGPLYVQLNNFYSAVFPAQAPPQPQQRITAAAPVSRPVQPQQKRVVPPPSKSNPFGQFGDDQPAPASKPVQPQQRRVVPPPAKSNPFGQFGDDQPPPVLARKPAPTPEQPTLNDDPSDAAFFNGQHAPTAKQMAPLFPDIDDPGYGETAEL